MRVSKTNKLVARPVNKLYLVEREDIDVNTNKPRREAAVIGELKRKYTFSLFWGVFDIANTVQRFFIT